MVPKDDHVEGVVQNYGVYSLWLIILCRANVVRNNQDRNTHVCQHGSHWSHWIDRHSPEESGGNEHESMSHEEIQTFCGGGSVTYVECYSGSDSFLEAGQHVTCNVEQGLVCKNNDNLPQGCQDFKVRYYCQCNSEAKIRVSRKTHCPQWSSWYNDHTPSASDSGDTESRSRVALETFCPSSLGKTITTASCKDTKGEAFSGAKHSNMFKASCTHTNGLICTPNPGQLCADFSIRYCCTMPPPGAVVVTTQAIKATTEVTTEATTETTTEATTETTTEATTETTTEATTTETTSLAAAVVATSHSSSASVNSGSSLVSVLVKGDAGKQTANSALSKATETVKEKYYSAFGTKFNIWIALLCVSIVLSLLHCFLTYFTYKRLSKFVKKKRAGSQRHVHPMNVKW